MQQNQTAAELAKEYEQMAIAATNDYCKLKRHKPDGAFPTFVKQVDFCTTMYVLWKNISRRLAEAPELNPRTGFVDYSPVNDEPDNYYNEYDV